MSIDAGKSELEVVVSRLRRGDYGTYLAVKLAPRKIRDDLFFLYGFFMEVGQVPFKVDEPLLAEMRLQWWRDSLHKLARGEKVGHPLLDGFGPVLIRGGDPLLSELISIIDSYSYDIQKTMVPSREIFFEMQNQRFGGLLRAVLLIAGASTPLLVTIAGDAGKAIGFCDVVASLPVYLQHGMRPFPEDVLKAHGVGYQDLMAGDDLDLEKGVAIEAALLSMREGTAATSWDVKGKLSLIPRAERALFSRWFIVPRLLQKAIDDRKRGLAVESSLNPLRVYFTEVYRLI